MEDIDSSANIHNSTLSQSYCQGVNRIIHQTNEIKFFQLPKDVIKKREIDWEILFNKYNEEVPDESEIDMHTTDTEINEDDEEKDIDLQDNINNDNKNDEDTEKDADEEEIVAEEGENNYFIKNRTPIHKLPALVQYWVDTGNPPFQLNIDNDESESSMIEEQKLSPMVAHRRSDTDGKRDNSTSFLSSVDTAAYILSNTNVTTKADTLAIVEGAKKSDFNKISDNLKGKLNSSNDCTSINDTYNICNNNNDKNSINQDLDNPIEQCTNIKTVISELNALDVNNRVQVKLSVIENGNVNTHEICDKLPEKTLLQSSMKITDILPTLEQFDKKLNENNNDNSSDIIESSNNYTSRSMSNRKSLTRKKLFTKRESPIDLIMCDIKYNKFKYRPRADLHPALQRTPSLRNSRLLQRSKRNSWIARKRKRKVKNSPLNSIIEENNSQLTIDDDNNNDNNHDTYTNDEKSELSNTSKRMPSFNTSYKIKSLRHRTNVTGTIQSKLINKCNASTLDRTKLSLRNLRSRYKNHRVDNDIDVINNNGKVKSKDELITLCKTQYVQVKLQKIDYTQFSTEKIQTIVDTTDHSTIESSSTISQRNNLDLPKIDIDVQDSDQSTILIAKCMSVNNAASLNQTQSDFESICTKLSGIEQVSTIHKSSNKQSAKPFKNKNQLNKNNVIIDNNNSRYNIENIQNTEDCSTDDDSDVFVSKLNRTRNILPLEKTLQQSGGKRKKLFNNDTSNKNSQDVSNADGKIDLQNPEELRLLSDEEDDFTRMIRKQNKRTLKSPTNILSTSSLTKDTEVREIQKFDTILPDSNENIVELDDITEVVRKTRQRTRSEKSKEGKKLVRKKSLSNANKSKADTGNNKLSSNKLITSSTGLNASVSECQKLLSPDKVSPYLKISTTDDENNSNQKRNRSKRKLKLNDDTKLNSSTKSASYDEIMEFPSSKKLKIAPNVQDINYVCETMDVEYIDNKNKFMNSLNLSSESPSLLCKKSSLTEQKVDNIENTSISPVKKLVATVKPTRILRSRTRLLSSETDEKLVNDKINNKNNGNNNGQLIVNTINKNKSKSKSIDIKINSKNINNNNNNSKNKILSQVQLPDKQCYILINKCSTESVDSGVYSPTLSCVNSVETKQSDMEILPHNVITNNRNNDNKNDVLLKRKKSTSGLVKKNLKKSRNIKRLQSNARRDVMKNHHILSCDDESSDEKILNDMRKTRSSPRARRSLEVSSNDDFKKINKIEFEKFSHFDGIFPNPIDEMFEIDELFTCNQSNVTTSKQSTKNNNHKKNPNSSSSNCDSRNSRIQFCTKLDSDSD